MAIRIRPDHESNVAALTGLVLAMSVFVVWMDYDLGWRRQGRDNTWSGTYMVLAMWWLWIALAWNARRRFKRARRQAGPGDPPAVSLSARLKELKLRVRCPKRRPHLVRERAERLLRIRHDEDVRQSAAAP